MPTVKMPDGAQVQFPDDMPPDQIRSLIAQKFPDAADPLKAKAAETRKYIADTVSNIPSSAVNFATNTVQPFIHPVDTAENIGKIGKGVLQKFGIVSGDDHEKYADAVGQFFKDRYGSYANIEKTLKEDPVGTLADLSAVLTAGGSAASRAPGVLGEVGNAVSSVGRAVDPLSAVSAVGTKVAAPLAAEAIGGLTGTGGKSLRLAAEAGAEGGEAGRAFRDNISGKTPINEVVADAKNALGQIKQERGQLYRSGMVDVGSDKTVLNFKDIDASLKDIQTINKYKTEELSPKTLPIRKDLAQTVANWEKLDPKEFHTAEGFDALKKQIGDIRDATEYGTPQRIIADKVYNAVKQTIVDQAPKYADVMEGYASASSIVKEIESTLTGKPGASIDSSVRKLQSVLRNNVNTNYGNRTALADYLVSHGAPNLLTKLAGQSLNSWTPRGLGHVSNAGELAFALHELANGNPKAAAAIGAMLPASSPKLMGLSAYGLGTASSVARPSINSAQQLGRASGLGQ